MHVRSLILVLSLVPACLLGAAWMAAEEHPGQPNAVVELLDLHAAFHEANTTGDYGLMHSLWADDAVVNAGGGTFVGPDEIADYFAAQPTWGVSASLAPTYKTNYDVRGAVASLQFECILVFTGSFDPLETPLSTIPFGGQNPNVLIVAHLTATCTAVKDNGRWVFQTLDGTPGPIQ